MTVTTHFSGWKQLTVANWFILGVDIMLYFDCCYSSLCALYKIVGRCEMHWKINEKSFSGWILAHTLYHGSIMHTLYFSVGPCKNESIYLFIYLFAYMQDNIAWEKKSLSVFLFLSHGGMFCKPVKWLVYRDFCQQIDPLLIKVGKITYVHGRYIQALFI